MAFVENTFVMWELAEERDSNRNVVIKKLDYDEYR